MDVTSSDGTTIHADEVGEGPPILFVPGSTLDASAAAGISNCLAPRFRCFAMDRRGRGKSGDGAAHSMALEVDDILALAHAIGKPLTLFGHSYGALCVLQAAPRCPEVASVILYDPPFPIDSPVRTEIRAAVRAALANRGSRQAMLLFLEQIVQLGPDELAMVKTLPDEWFEERAATTVREMDALYDFDIDRDLRLPDALPVSVLLGSESSAELRGHKDRILHDLPRVAICTLEGQGHNAMLFAPDMVARAIDEHMQKSSLGI